MKLLLFIIALPIIARLFQILLVLLFAPILLLLDKLLGIKLFGNLYRLSSSNSSSSNSIECAKELAVAKGDTRQLESLNRELLESAFCSHHFCTQAAEVDSYGHSKELSSAAPLVRITVSIFDQIFEILVAQNDFGNSLQEIISSMASIPVELRSCMCTSAVSCREATGGQSIGNIHSMIAMLKESLRHKSVSPSL